MYRVDYFFGKAFFLKESFYHAVLALDIIAVTAATIS
jgi:hypothetical protein